MTSETIKQIVNEATTDSSGKWLGTEDVENLLYNTLQECVTIIETTPLHCAYTTHDLGTVQCTIEQTVKLVRNKFGLKNIKDFK